MNSQLTPLNSTGIYIVEVEIDANNFCIDPNDDSGSIEYYHSNNQEENFILLPEGNWQLLGTITSDIISFDPAPYLESKKSNMHVATAYKNYITDGWTWSKEDSFRSLLTSCGIEVANKLHLALIKK